MSVYLEFNNTGCINRQQMYNRGKEIQFNANKLNQSFSLQGNFIDTKSLARFLKRLCLYEKHGASIPMFSKLVD